MGDMTTEAQHHRVAPARAGRRRSRTRQAAVVMALATLTATLWLEVAGAGTYPRPGSTVKDRVVIAWVSPVAPIRLTLRGAHTAGPRSTARAAVGDKAEN